MGPPDPVPQKILQASLDTPTALIDGTPTMSARLSTQDSSHTEGSTHEQPVSDNEKALDIETQGGIAEQQDPNVVDWDGPDDPANPRNWKNKKKWTIVGVLSFLTFVTPLASSMFAPGVPLVLSDFGSTSRALSSFIVSVYILGYAAGPVIIAPLSELYGRRWLYNVTNVLFIVFTVACALAQNMGQLIAFRFIAGLMGSTVLTIGGGTLADLFVQEERGKAMAFWSSGPLLGPVAGPVCGGFLAQAKGWRWVFWLIAIAGGAATILCFFVFEETYSVTILEAKTKKLKKETGNAELTSKMDTGLAPVPAFKRAIVRPIKMLFLSPIVLAFSVYNAIIYGYLYLVFTTLSIVFEEGYGFNSGIVGLTFLGIGVGMFTGLILFGTFSDKYLKKKSAQGEMKPEYRLPPLIPAAFFIPAGLILYGWTAQYQIHWIAPIIGTSLLGFGIIAAFMAIQSYLVDAFTLHAASAVAANTILRSLLGALLPLAGPDMYAALGLGWGNSLLGFIALALIPLPFVFLKYGELIRTKYPVKL